MFHDAQVTAGVSGNVHANFLESLIGECNCLAVVEERLHCMTRDLLGAPAPDANKATATLAPNQAFWISCAEDELRRMSALLSSMSNMLARFGY